MQLQQQASKLTTLLLSEAFSLSSVVTRSHCTSLIRSCSVYKVSNLAAFCRAESHVYCSRVEKNMKRVSCMICP